MSSNKLYSPQIIMRSHRIIPVQRNLERGQFTTHIGLSYKNHDSKTVEELASFEFFCQGGKEEARTGLSNVDRGPQKFVRKPYSLDQSCLLWHNELGFTFAQFRTWKQYSYVHHWSERPGPLPKTHQMSPIDPPISATTRAFNVIK